jgi:HlyD family secretion protein
MRSLLFFIPLAALAGCEQATEVAAPAVYDSAPVDTRSIQVTVDAAGVVEPESTIEVKSKASGEVLAVHAETGDVVEAGSLLVEIDKRTPRNSLSQTEAALTAAEARRKIAQTQMERAQALFKTQTLTQADVEQTQLEFANAESQVVSAKVAVENARITLEDTDVRAPITGTIIEKTVEPGTVIASTTQNVSGGTTLMKMADLTTVQVRTRVDETDIGKIQPGMPTRVTVAAYPNQPFEGQVLKIEPQALVEQNVTQFSVLIKIANRGGLLKPGMNAEVQIQIADREDVPAVPTAALRADTDVPLTAVMLGLDEATLRAKLWPEGAPAGAMPMPAVYQQPRGNPGGGNFGGGRPPGGAGFVNGASPQAPAAARTAADYQFGGDYWVVALRGDEVVPVAVKTGVTDLEYSEVLAGLEPGDRVLLLPSTSLYEQQEQLQQFISQRFGSSTPFQQPQQQNQNFRGFR